MIVCLIICITLLLCVIYITQWIKHMVSQNLPLFTFGKCEWVSEEPTESKEPKPIGFVPEITEHTPEKKPTDKEQKEALLQDPTTLLSALLRGEVDIDDINTRN